MTHLDTILGTLLLRNNCVIIPSLGGFIANYVSAKVDVKNGLITPPRKALSFNKSLNTNDGLIIHHLANQEDISFDKAKEIVAIEVQQIKAELNKGLRVHFHNVGFIYINSAGKIAFEQERFFNLLLSSYGLGNVQFITENETKNAVPKEVKVEKTTRRKSPEPIVPSAKEEKKIPRELKTVPVVEQPEPTTKEEVEEEVVQDEIAIYEEPDTAKVVEHPAVAEERTSKGLISKIIKYTAVAALVPVLFYSFWIPMKTDVLQSGIVYQEDFNPFYKTEAFNYLPDANKTSLWIDSAKSSQTLSSITNNLSSSTPVFTYPLDDDLYIPVRRVKKTENTEKVKATPKVVAPIQRNNYHAIVGCFSNPNNAKKVISRLNSKGFNAYEVDVKGGLHRISAGDTKTRSAMNTIQQRLRSKDIASWVLKK